MRFALNRCRLLYSTHSTLRASFSARTAFVSRGHFLATRIIPNANLLPKLLLPCCRNMSSGDTSKVAAELVKKWLEIPPGSPHHVVIFSKTWCPYCTKVKQLFKELDEVNYSVIELDKRQDEGDGASGEEIQAELFKHSAVKTVPQVFINGKFAGDSSQIHEMKASGALMRMINENNNNSSKQADKTHYDLIVIGGGSGGLACSKEAVKQKGLPKVCVLDLVKPTPIGTTWGLGGTCVNVGCIPKKLMHKAALMHDTMADAGSYGWAVGKDGVPLPQHKWESLREEVQNYIKSLNFGYRKTLRDTYVEYFNAYGEFVDGRTVKLNHKRTRKGDPETITGDKILIATGLRPKYPDIPGAKEFGITSDDLFALPYAPGKTLCVGASYVSLECAGFLHGIGFEVDVGVRSILLRGFDQDIAERIGKDMADRGIKFHRPWVPTRVEQIEPNTKEKAGRFKVFGKAPNSGEEALLGEYNTVVWAIGREPHFEGLNLDKAGVKLNPKTGKVLVDDCERAVTDGSSANGAEIYAIGDAIDNWELTPVAIQAGRRLARRMFGGSVEKMDYTNVPTTVFTPLEYGACGLTEADAIATFGADDVEVYHSLMAPLEWTLPHREAQCYVKLVCVKSQKERVVGLHVLAPDAGEITQGYAVAMKLNATKKDFDATVGIHPTNSEVFTVLDITKSSGIELTKSAC